MSGSVSPDHFDRLFSQDPDPWRFETSAYEDGKYAETLAMLGGRRFAAAFEPGCANGVFTARLAPCCTRLLAADGSVVAVDLARTRCRALPQVELQRMVIPTEWPSESFDLIMLSEVLYFLTPDDVGRTAARAATSLREGGLIVLVNWLGQTDTPCTGSLAADLFIDTVGLAVTETRLRPCYRLDVLGWPP
jgi:hypothetical protein